MVVVCACALLALLLGLSLELLAGDDDGLVDFRAVLLIALVVLVLAAVATAAAVRAMPRDDLDIEIMLFLVPSAVVGIVLFLLVFSSYVVGLYLPFALGLDDWGEDGETTWLGAMIIFLIAVGLLSIVLGGPVGILAWASKLAKQEQ